MSIYKIHTDCESICLLPNKLTRNTQKNLPPSLYRDTHHDDNHVLPMTTATSIKPPTTTRTSARKRKLILVNEEKIKPTHKEEELNRGSVGNLIKIVGCRRNLHGAGRKGPKKAQEPRAILVAATIEAFMLCPKSSSCFCSFSVSFLHFLLILH